MMTEENDETQKAWREKNTEILKEKRKIYEAKKKEERLLSKPVITEEEKEAIQKEKRDKYNENRRLKRLQDKVI
jgi:hypothetical protein